MTDREIMQQALDALLHMCNTTKAQNDYNAKIVDKALVALETAHAQPEQATIESIYETIVKWDEGGGKRSRRELARRIVALYTAPPRKEWVGLTSEELATIIVEHAGFPTKQAQAINEKLKEKNA